MRYRMYGNNVSVCLFTADGNLIARETLYQQHTCFYFLFDEFNNLKKPSGANFSEQAKSSKIQAKPRKPEKSKKSLEIQGNPRKSIEIRENPKEIHVDFDFLGI